ncbi:ceramidase domain-containing protein [Shimia sp. R10_1]|uniref:ceramidase domain-containing protein n=1 Tax=Shimia sp. R10_1 TaxID=2821095 RepID=UPI001ADD2F68|nr:ceramidase domain-containing protein [Shimia sp. R10_1]MBO9474917.1 ceramidase domain-containing protein [Shimia sp. R10_1]
MDWTAQVDAYCERMGPAFWAEPVNAVTNAAFVLAALWMWGRLRDMPAGGGKTLARTLCVILALIGIGSFLFHTYATRWAGVADVAPIAIYVLLYIYAANRHYWRLRPLWASVATLGFFPYAALTIPLFSQLPLLGVSAAYMPVPVMILGYAFALRGRLPGVARGLAIGGGILLASLTFRSLDMPMCEAVPFGTHFMWHVLNGVMLGWMIEVLRRHIVQQAGTRAQ